MLIHSCTKTVKKAPCTLIQNLGFIFWDLNQSNPSIKIAMDVSRQGWSCISFFMPFATVCNHLQPELSGMVKNHIFGGFTPIFTEF
jgi:hypothetical protein